MKTYFIQNDSLTFRNFLSSKNVTFIDNYKGLTGIDCRSEQDLFFLGLQYGEYLSKL